MDNDKDNDKTDPSVDDKNLLVKSATHYTPDSLLTSGMLADLWGVHRQTAAKIIAELEANGLRHIRATGVGHKRYRFADVQKHLEAIKQTA